MQNLESFYKSAEKKMKIIISDKENFVKNMESLGEELLEEFKINYRGISLSDIDDRNIPLIKFIKDKELS